MERTVEVPYAIETCREVKVEVPVERIVYVEVEKVFAVPPVTTVPRPPRLKACGPASVSERRGGDRASPLLR